MRFGKLGFGELGFGDLEFGEMGGHQMKCLLSWFCHRQSIEYLFHE